MPLHIEKVSHSYGTVEALEEAFVTFANRVPFYGAVIANLDDPGVRRLLPHLHRRVVTYGFSPQADVQGRAVTLTPAGGSCQVMVGGREMGTLAVRLPGRHMVSNALAALAREARVVWVGPRIEPQVQLQWLVARGCAAGLAIRQGTEANYLRLDAHLARTSPVPYVSQNRLFNLEFPRDPGGCGGLLRKDGDHFSALGVSEMARRADVVAAANAFLQ